MGVSAPIPAASSREGMMVDTPQVEASRSGLPWLSGMTGRSTGEDMIAELRRFEERRGRKVDISTCFANHQEGWEEYLDAYFWRNGLGEALVEEGVHIAMSIAPVPEAEGPAGIAAAARGEYDRRHRVLARRLKAFDAPPPLIVRLGWEFQQDDRAYSPKNDESPGFRDYKQMHRRVADIYKEVAGALIDWCSLRRGRMVLEEVYPGDDWVDIVGVDLYGNGDPIRDDADWATYYDLTLDGTPAGPRAFLEFARARGKRLSVPEWGVSHLSNAHDSRRYIRGMWEFFNEAAADGTLLYESYFHRDTAKSHLLFPPTRNPRAAARYRELWSEGA